MAVRLFFIFFRKEEILVRRREQIRTIVIKKYTNTVQTFIGRIVRNGKRIEAEDTDENTERPYTLLQPLYMEENGEWVFADHVWLELPPEYKENPGKIIKFKGKVIRYKNGNGRRAIKLVEIISLEKGDDSGFYNGLDMRPYGQPDIPLREDRKIFNENLATIRAYEMGTLPEKKRVKHHYRKGGRKKPRWINEEIYKKIRKEIEK